MNVVTGVVVSGTLKDLKDFGWSIETTGFKQCLVGTLNN